MSEKERIIELIKKGKTKKAAELLVAYGEGEDVEIRRASLLLLANYSDSENRNNLGLLSDEKFDVAKAKTANSILSLLEEFQEEDSDKWGKNGHEIFNEEKQWDKLERIGHWQLDKDQVIIGEGVNQYLLSEGEYGEKTFTINAKVSFAGYAKYRNRHLDNGNSGIVLGWVENGTSNSYLNLLFTGEKLLFEQVGEKGGGEYEDFDHIGEGRNFMIKEDQLYFFSIRVSKNRIDVFVDNDFFYSAPRPNALLGKVGLRPWRARLTCEFFEVRELGEKK